MSDGPTREMLNGEQAVAIQWLDNGWNVFLTGIAGCGKTFLLNTWLADVDKNVAITASTGIAATHLGGQTLHSWLAARPERDTVERLCTDSWMDRHAARIAAIDALVIDEVSMVDGKLLALAEAAHRFARKNNEPWGGVQVILVGDLGQLPPVQEEHNGWCFQAAAWAKSNIQTVELTKTMRQEDAEFAALLYRVRTGDVGSSEHSALSDRYRAYDPEEENAVRLVTHNEQAYGINDDHLQRLDDIHTFVAEEEGSPRQLAQLDKHCLSPRKLSVAVGARVMFTRNSWGGDYVNGSMGEVVRLGDGELEDYIAVKLDNTGGVVNAVRATWEAKEWSAAGKGATLKKLASRTQFPLRLAWAITIHKSQGCTLDKVSVDLTRCFAPGQAYVALSRCRSMEGLNIEGWQGLSSIIVHPMVSAAYGKTA